jgi:putative hemolysin
LGHLPSVGEQVEFEGHLFTVIELDGRRVARLRFSPRPLDAAPEPAASRPAADADGG